jgi:hypothetical protein
MIPARQCVRRRASGQSPSGDVGLAIMVYYFVLNALVKASLLLRQAYKAPLTGFQNPEIH